MARPIIFAIFCIFAFAAVCLADSPPPTTFDVANKSHISSNKSGPVEIGSMVVNLTGLYSQTNYNFNGGRDNNASQALLSAGFLRFIASNTSLGFRMMYSHVGYGKASSDEFSFGPAVGFFLGEGKRKGYPYVVFSPQFATISSGNGLYGIGITIEAGYAHFIARNAAVTAAIGYSQLALKQGNNSYNGATVGISLGLATFIY